ncbi:MAG: cation:proton antiporter [Limisphaerales bacterium]
MNPTAIEGHLRMVMLQWGIIIAVAWIFGRLGKKVGQPLAVGEILAGLLLGPSALGLIWPHDWAPLFPNETQQSLQLLGKIGLILLLFQVGMEFDYAHLRTRSKTVIGVSIAGIVVPMLGGLLIGKWLHTTFAPQTKYVGFQLFVCIALSITALPIMGRILLEMKLERTALGALCISAAAIDDVIGWIGLAVITSLATSNFDWFKVTLQTAGVITFFIFLRKVVGPIIKWYWRKSVTKGGDGTSPNSASARMPPTFLAVLLIMLFGACEAASYLKVFSLFGAFMFGVAIHDQVDLVKSWRDQFANFVLVALVPIFFTNTGLRTEIGSINSGIAWLACGAILAVAAIGKLAGCGIVAKLSGQSTRDSLCIAALMNTRALMALVAINVGYELKLLPKELFSMFIIMALVTTAMTGPLLKWGLPNDLYNMVPDYPKRRRKGAGVAENVPVESAKT